jgi:hypothetical protein
MTDRRLLAYNDARHSYIYYYDPPIRLEDAWRPVDEIVGTGVDTLVYGFGAGPTMFHNTEVGEQWGSHLEAFPMVAGWRAYENLKSLNERGLDPLNLLIDRAHDKGIEFFGSLRQSHPADPSDRDDVIGWMFNWQFRIDHPEWCLKGRGKHAFDWTNPAVRSERFALVEETVNDYDVDGFEIDWTFWPHYFEDDAAEAKAHVLTEFMSEVRATVDAASAKKGKKIALGARVLPTLAGNRSAGMDVTAWIEQGALDFVVPTVYQDRQIDADFPFEWIVDVAKANGCELYPSLQDHVGTDPGVFANLDQYRAAAAAYWAKGADGIYLPWFRWPHEAEERDILGKIRDPKLLSHGSKHYVVRRDHEMSVAQHYGAQLPASIEVGQTTRPAVVSFYVADSFTVPTRSTLRLTIYDHTIHDDAVITLNGTELAVVDAWRTTRGFTHVVLDFALASGALRTGTNEVTVSIRSRPDNLGTELPRLDSVEVFVEYPKPEVFP